VGLPVASKYLLWYVAAALLGCHVDATDDAPELTFAVEKSASTGTHALSIEHAPFGIFGFDTRGFDGGIPGPTFRMNPGETLTIVLTNNLLSENSLTCADGRDFCETAITNLHTHGLHVSSKGRRDGLDYSTDDVFAEVAPGESETFKFEIPDFHMPGTHWYHPHHHHATALQAGGGAAGVLIVNDPVGYLPDVFANMPERILMISGHNLQTLQDMARDSESGLLENAVQTAEDAGLPTNVFLVNGHLGPQMTMSSHTWHRFRMVYAAVEQSLNLGVTDTTNGGDCSFELMAKDGVYLHSFPRAISTVHLFPGARSDVAVACTCATYPCTVTIGSGANRRLRRRRLQKGRPGGGGPPPGAPGGGMATVDVLILTITETANGAVEDLPTTVVQRPCYLVDLQGYNVPASQTGNLALNGGGRLLRWNNDNNDESMTHENVHANGGTKYTWPALTTFQSGSVYEVQVTGANAHPFHQHINPYQIVNLPGGPYGDGYFQEGDWHDTLMVDELGGGNAITVRMQTDTFTGKQVLHCHILEHEDEGMMAFLDIAGNEGATWSGAEEIDPQCLRSAFVSSETTRTTTVTTTEPTTTTTTSTVTTTTATTTIPTTTTTATATTTATTTPSTTMTTAATTTVATTVTAATTTAATISTGITTEAVTTVATSATTSVTTAAASTTTVLATTPLDATTTTATTAAATADTVVTGTVSTITTTYSSTSAVTTTSTTMAVTTQSTTTLAATSTVTTFVSSDATTPFTGVATETAATVVIATTTTLDSTATAAATTTTTTTTTTAAEVVVAGSLAFSLDEGDGQAFIENFNADNSGEVGEALRASIAAPLEGISPEDVIITRVGFRTARRLGHSRALQSADLEVDYEIHVATSAPATAAQVAVSLASTDAAATIASSLSSDLSGSYGVSAVEVTASIVTTPPLRWSTADAETTTLGTRLDREPSGAERSWASWPSCLALLLFIHALSL